MLETVVQYRVSTVLLVITATAIALAGRPWLIGRNDFGVAIVLFTGWTALGFCVGQASASWKSERLSVWMLAMAGIAANWVFWYTTGIAVASLASADNVLPGLPRELRWLCDVTEARWLAIWLVGWSPAVVVAAALKRTWLVKLLVAASLVTWFVIHWWGFVRLSIESDSLD